MLLHSLACSTLALYQAIREEENDTWFQSFLSSSAGTLGSVNAVLCLQLLGRSAQVHLSQFVQELLHQRKVQHATSTPSSCVGALLGPHPQHLVVSFPALSVIHFRLFDHRFPHAKRTHQFLHSRDRNKVQHRVDQVRDCRGGRSVLG